MGFSEKVSYLKGLADGLKLDEGSTESRLFRAIIDAMDELATAVSALEETTSALGSEVDDLNEDLSDVEDILYGEENDDEDDEQYEVKCPTCGEEITLDEQMIHDGKLKCPGCSEDIELEFGCDCGSCKDGQGNILHIHGDKEDGGK